MGRTRSIKVAVGLFCGLLIFPTVARTQLKTVAVKGDDSPVPGATYQTFGAQRPAVSDATGPRVLFRGRVRGSKGTQKGIFEEDPDGGGVAIVLKEDVAPGGKKFVRFRRSAINAGGTVVWESRLTGGGRGIFREGPTPVAQVGDTVPGVTGRLDRFFSASIADDGGVAFGARLSGGATVAGTEVNQGLFRCSGGDGNCSQGTGTLEALVLRGDPVPDRPGRSFCSFARVAASNYGVAFTASTKGNCASTGEVSRDGVFRMPFGTTATTIALEGEPAEPVPQPGGTTYGSVTVQPYDSPAIENDGIVAFRARTLGILAKEVIYLCDPAACPAALAEAVVVQGSPDPSGSTYRRLSAPVLSDAGDMAFWASSRGSSGTSMAIYVRRADGLTETIVSRGDPVPDLIPPRTFGQLYRPVMSSGGRIAFRAKVRSTVPPRRRLPGIFVVE